MVRALTEERRLILIAAQRLSVTARHLVIDLYCSIDTAPP